MPTPQQHKDAVKARAIALGFDAFGVAALPDAEPRSERFLQWLACGAHGQMSWLERSNERRLFPKNILPGARSVICVGVNYFRQPPPTVGAGTLARYAAGRDYHRVLFKRQKQLCAFLRELGGENKPYVDTGPVLEKAFAERAGLGWQGKSSLLISERFGPWLMLGVIFTTLELPPDAPSINRCGSCRRCADACPTGALDGAGFLDARRCLAYLTIEHKGPLSDAQQDAMGGCLLGCDRCAQACPWGRHCPSLPTLSDALAEPVALPDMLAWDEARFRAHFAGTAALRPGWDGWQRNLLAVLGNIGEADALAPLEHWARTHADSALHPAAVRAVAKIRQRIPTLLSTP